MREDKGIMLRFATIRETEKILYTNALCLTAKSVALSFKV